MSDSTGVEEVVPFGLFRYTSDAATGEEVYRFLWPFGIYRTRGEECFFQLYPLIYYRVRLDQNGLPDSQGFVFPFVFWGESADEGFYFGNFFWGDLKAQFGKDDLSFRGGIAYMHFRDKGFHSSHVLFPLINWVWGDGHSGWRVWPFYGHYEKTDPEGRQIYDRNFVLWPFFIHNWNNLNSAHPSETLFLFPFYGSITSETLSDHTVIWPLFRYFASETADESYWELRAPFPVFILGRGTNMSKTFVWPLFGIKETEERFVQFALWPLQRYESIENERVSETRFWFLPLFWHYAYAYKTGPDAGKTRSETKVWPLFKYVEKVDGSRYVSLFSPLWFKDPEGFDEIWDPLFRVWYEEVQPDGGVLTQVLWGLYSSLVDDLGYSASIWPLFTHWGEVEGRGAWVTVLGGLWEHRSFAGRDAYRLFWIPFGDELTEVEP